MFALFRLLALLLISLVVLIMGNSFFITFVSLRLDLAGTSSEMIGIITASFYTGMLLASFLAPSWIRRLGHLRVWILLCGVNGLLILFHALWVDAIYWLLLRFFSGIMLGGVFVVIESWFLLLCPSRQRSLTLAIYVLAYYFATAIGQLFLYGCDLFSWTPYLEAGALSVLAIVPCIIRPIPLPNYVQSQPLHFLKTLRTSFQGFFGGFISGMLLSCVYGLTPVYALKIGRSVPDVGTMMAVIVFGGLVLQLPLGKWADLWNRRKVMVVTCFFSVLFSISIALFDNIYWIQLLLLLLFGGFSFVIYPLALALACEKISDDQIIAVTGGLNVTYGAGAMAGPLLAPLFMGWLGSGGLFYFLGGISLILGLVGCDVANKRINIRKR